MQAALIENAVSTFVVFMMCLQISFQDHGSPESFQTNTEVTIRVKDADDQNPVFTKPVYHANVTESAQITVSVLVRARASLELVTESQLS